MKDPQNNNNNINNIIPETPLTGTKVRKGGHGRGRGRTTRSTSRKRSHSTGGSPTEKTNNQNDILSILSELKNEIFQKIDSKVDDLKREFQASITNIRESIDEITSGIDLGETNQNLSNKIDCMKVNVKENTEYISSVKSQNEHNLQLVNTHIQDVEVSLATDIETLKLNIEDKLGEGNNVLAEMKEQLSNMQTNFKSERDKNRDEFKKLYDDFTTLQNTLHEQNAPENNPDPSYQNTNQNQNHNARNVRTGCDYKQRAKERGRQI